MVAKVYGFSGGHTPDASRGMWGSYTMHMTVYYLGSSVGPLIVEYEPGLLFGFGEFKHVFLGA